MSILTALKMAPWLAILLLLGTVAAQSSQIHKWHTQADHCATAREVDRQSYVNAQKQAQAANQAEVAKQEAKSREITKETHDAYQNDLARLRADAAERLRKARAATPASPAGKPGSPQGPGPTAGADDPGSVRLSAEEFLRAQEIELRLMHLQNWVRDQLNAQ